MDQTIFSVLNMHFCKTSNFRVWKRGLNLYFQLSGAIFVGYSYSEVIYFGGGEQLKIRR